MPGEDGELSCSSPEELMSAQPSALYAKRDVGMTLHSERASGLISGCQLDALDVKRAGYRIQRSHDLYVPAFEGFSPLLVIKGVS